MSTSHRESHEAWYNHEMNKTLKNKYFKLFSLLVIVLFSFALVLPNEAFAARRGNPFQSKINKLDDDRVDELPVPILFGLTPLNLSKNFADPRDGGARSHEGLDIMAPKGAPIASPTEAVVTRIGEGDSAGLYVYTVNPGGESMAYLHLDAFAEDLDEGDVLKVGQIIGYVGNTGNASATAPHLHFELHDDDGRPIDPFPRLTRIFPLQAKIDGIAAALKNEDDEDELADFVVLKYRSEFLLARSLGIELPDEINDRLEKVVSVILPTLATAPNMSLGSKGEAVQALQSFLIGKNILTGSSIVADGSFGPKTKQALMDYQQAMGITPVDGSFGPKTRNFIALHP